MLYAKKGDKMKCNSCDKSVYEFTQDVSVGDPVEAALLKGLEDYPSPSAGEEARCPNCKAGLLFGGHVVVQ